MSNDLKEKILDGDVDKLESFDEQMDDINVQELEDSLWETELELALLTRCDYGTIRNIAKCRRMPDELRAKVWQVNKTQTFG